MALPTLILLHGLGGNSKENWFPWISEKFKNRAKIISFDLPNTLKPLRKEWLIEILKNLPTDVSDTYLIGHSLGGTAMIYLLHEWKDIAFAGALLIASPMDDLGWDNLEQFFDFEIKKFDFEKIKTKAKKFRLLYSDDDPYVPLTHGAFFQMKLQAPLTVVEGKGHLNGEVEEEVKAEIMKLVG